MPTARVVQNGVSDELVELAARLYRFLVTSEGVVRRPKRSSPDHLGTLAEHARRLTDHVSTVKARASERLERLVDDVAHSLNELLAALEQRDSYRELKAAWNRLGQTYEKLVSETRPLQVAVKTGTLGHVKPRNLARNLFHLSMGVGGILLYELVLSRGAVIAVGGSLLAFFVFLDVLRRVSPHWNERLVKRVFGKISRPSEAHRVPSATWYLSGLVIGVLVFPQHAIELGTLALACGDPAASLAGKRWGAIKLYRDRSLVGTLTFCVTVLPVGLLFLTLVRPDLALVARFGVAAAVTVVGAATELFSHRLDDNLTIPLMSAATATLLL